MKRSVATWLLVGLSLGVPQFCKGEVAGPGCWVQDSQGVPWETPRKGLEAVPQAGQG